MKTLKAFFLTLILVVGFGCFCDCPELVGDYYNILGLNDLKHIQIKNNEYLYLEGNDTVKFEDYKGLMFGFKTEFVFGENEAHIPFHFSLMNTAYGTSCPCYFYTDGHNGSLQEVKSFDIITMNDFDSVHLANDTINEYFITSYNVPLDSFLLQKRTNLHKPFGIGGDEEQLMFQLSLTERPTLDSTFQVKVNIELNDGAVYSTESDAIFIK
ncbi:MAG: hypothetical protein ACPG19_03110 [Saprospiraceae bacterium]